MPLIANVNVKFFIKFNQVLDTLSATPLKPGITGVILVLTKIIAFTNILLLLTVVESKFIQTKQNLFKQGKSIQIFSHLGKKKAMVPLEHYK